MILAAKLILLFIILYGYLGFSGFGLYYLIIPPKLWRRGWSVVVSPVLGLAQISIAGAWIFGLNLPGGWIFWAQFGLAIIILFYAIVQKSDLIKSDLEAAWATISHHKFLLVIAVLAYLFLCLPILSSGFLTESFRVGADVCQYPIQADFLQGNGTLEAAKKFDWAANPYADIIFWNTHVMRWGTAFVLSSFMQITGLRAYDISFVSLMVMVFLTGAAMAYFLRLLEMSLGWIAGGALALIFNPNWLNIFYEHLEGQAYAMPLTILLFASLTQLLSKGTSCSRKDLTRGMVCVSVLAAGIIIQHNETFLLVCLFLLAVFVFHSIWINRKLTPALLIPLPIFVFVCILTGPAILGIAQYYETFVSGSIGSGWLQPKWALLSDIDGFSNIYANFPAWTDADHCVKILARSSLEWGSVIVASGLLLILCLTGSFKRPIAERIMYWAALGAVLICFVASYLLGLTQTNYFYFKIYTILLPLLIASLVVSVFSIRQGFLSRWRDAVAIILLVCILANGVDYILEYNRTAMHVSKAESELLLLKNDPRYVQMVYLSCPYGGEVNLYRYSDRLHDFALMELLPGRIIDQFVDKKTSLDRLANYPVTLIVYKNTKYAELFKGRKWPVLYENEGIVLYKTGKKVSDIITDAGLKLNSVYGLPNQ
jgi:hypothetical protein